MSITRSTRCGRRSRTDGPRGDGSFWKRRQPHRKAHRQRVVSASAGWRAKGDVVAIGSSTIHPIAAYDRRTGQSGRREKMRMLTFTAIAAITSSVAVAQTEPAPPPAPAATAHTTSVHTRTVTHHDGKRHPSVHKVVHRSTVATPDGTATRTTTATTKTTPQ
jgi:hypothetical protein